MQMEEKTLGNVRYLIRYPKGFDRSKTYPTILFLHGAGTRGDNMAVLQNNPFFALTAPQEGFPFIVVAPLCTENTWFDLWQGLKDLVRHTVSLPFVDETQLYGMGASMGGYGTWQLAMSLPQYFAAIAPICGGGMYWNAGRLVNVPVWAFHGGKDQVVFPQESEKMVNAVNRCGGNARLTVYPDNAHDAWSDTYSNPRVFAWLLEHTNENAAALKDAYTDQSVYG